MIFLLNSDTFIKSFNLLFFSKINHVIIKSQCYSSNNSTPKHKKRMNFGNEFKIRAFIFNQLRLYLFESHILSFQIMISNIHLKKGIWYNLPKTSCYKPINQIFTLKLYIVLICFVIQVFEKSHSWRYWDNFIR